MRGTVAHVCGFVALLHCGADPGPTLGRHINLDGLDAYDCSTTVTAAGGSATYAFPTTPELRQPGAPPPKPPSLLDCQNGAPNNVDQACDDTNQPHPTACKRHDSCMQLEFWTSTGDLAKLESSVGGSVFSISVECGGTTIYSVSNVTAIYGM